MPFFKSTLSILVATIAFLGVHVSSASAGSMESARRLVDLLGLQTELESTIIQSVDSAKTTLLQRGVPSETVNEVASALKAEMLESMPELIEEISTTYADEFTEPELQDLISFYESPTGQKFAASSKALKGKQEEAARAWLQQVQQRALARLQNS